MFKNKNTQALLFKLSQVVVFSALFFVQLQVKFIEAAYNDFSIPSVSTVSHTSSKQASLHKQDDNSDKEGYKKLNKRFSLSHAFLVLSAPVISSPRFHISTIRAVYKAPFVEAHFFCVQFLRGPPSLSV